MWEKIQPKYGDQIRVNRGFYYHHGIYASKECVIHFAPPNNTGTLDFEAARIIKTSLAEFLNGGELEVRVYDPAEMAKRRAPKEIVDCALSHLGEGGYNLISNNCEHFSNLCAFGTKTSSQVESVFAALFTGGR